MELEMERDLKALIERHREASRGLSTHWDADLGYMLQPSLAAYEQERVTGHAVDHADFQDAAAAPRARGHWPGLPDDEHTRARGRALAALERGDLSHRLKHAGRAGPHALACASSPTRENARRLGHAAVHYKKAT